MARLHAMVAGTLLVGMLAPGTRAEEVAWWTEGLEAALAAARQREALVMVDAWAEWCRFCTVMEENTFPEPRVASELSRGIIPLRLEVDERKGAGTAFAERYGIRGLPAVLFLDGEGREVHRVEHYVAADPFLEEIAWARLAAVPLAELETRVGEDPSGANLLALAERHRREGRAAEASRLYAQVAEADPDGSQDAADDALYHLAVERLEDGDTRDALDLLARLTALAPGSRTRSGFYLRLEVLESEGRVEELLETYRHMASVLSGEPAVLSDYAWYLAQLGRDLETAEGAARRAVDLDAGNADSWDTLGEVMFRRGQISEAVEAVEKAIELDPGNPDYRERRLRFVQALRRSLPVSPAPPLDG